MLKRKQIMFFAWITVAGVPMVLASVPRAKDVSNDTAIYQNLHEIRVEKIRSLDFDNDIQKLSAQEKAHREAIPLRLSAPMKRVQSTPYRAGDPKHKEQSQKRRHRN